MPFKNTGFTPFIIRFFNYNLDESEANKPTLEAQIDEKI